MTKSSSVKKIKKPKLHSREADAKAILAYMDGKPLPRGFRTTTRRFPPTPSEMRKIRKNLGLSQNDMSKLFNTPKKTYQNWEQGLSQPDGAVSVLFKLVESRPDGRQILTELG